MNWKPIDENTPQDELILLRKDFKQYETPCIVVGEIFTFKGEVHHAWRGPYEETIKIFKGETSWDEKFTHWAPLS